MTKIDIISGFLGAGKTTFIKKMLEEVFSGEKVVLVENEYGEVGIDGGFLKDAGIEIKELNSGCICCSLVGDFNRSLNEVIETYHPDRILIEPSGVGKLSDVMSSVKTFKGLTKLLAPKGLMFIKLNPFYEKTDMKQWGFTQIKDNLFEENGILRYRELDTASWKQSFEKHYEIIRYLEFPYPWQEGMNRLFLLQKK